MGWRLAVLLDDHALPNVGYPTTKLPVKLSDFWYNRLCRAVLGARGPLEHSKLRMRRQRKYSSEGQRPMHETRCKVVENP